MSGPTPEADDLAPVTPDFETIEGFFGQLAMRVVPSDTCDVAMEMAVAPHLLNIRGGIEGGILATMIDTVAGHAAVKDGRVAGENVTTAELSINFLAAVEVGPARAEATVVRAGRRQIVLQIDVWDVGRERLAAISTATFVRIQMREGQSEYVAPTF